MAWAYFDKSALIKRYVKEAGRREVLQLFRRNECVTSTYCPARYGALFDVAFPKRRSTRSACRRY